MQTRPATLLSDLKMISLHFLGIKIEIHYSFFILLGIILLSGNNLFAAAAVLFSFLHELTHEFVAKLLRYHPEKISFGLFGGVLHIRQGFIHPKDELLIHLAGPFLNLLAAAVLYVGYLYYPLAWMEEIILANILLAGFNLMPFYPLDGGKIVSLYLSIFLGYGRSYKISRLFTKIFSLFLFLLGIYLVQYNMLNLLISALAVNLYVAGKQDHSFIFYKVSKTIEARGRVHPPKIVVYRSDVRAIKALEKQKPLENRIFTIVNEKGSYKGQLTEEELLQGIYLSGIYTDFGRLLELKKHNRI